MSLSSKTTNKNNRGFEFHNEVQTNCQKLGFEYHGEGYSFGSIFSLPNRHLYRELSFESDVWHAPHRVDLLLTDGDKSMIIECKSQTNTGGTADVKLLEIPLNAQAFRVPSILVYEGTKFTKSKIKWMRDSASIEYPYFLGSFTIDEMDTFLTNYF
jgi:hypothetical protein